MANNFVGHVDKWLLLSETETDFAILFVRAWIPFNAWYCNHYQRTQDRYCLDQIKSDNNQFRAKLVALLNGDYDEALIFKSHLNQLHRLLEQHPIPDATTSRVTFKNLWFRDNPVTVSPPITKRGLEYKAEYLTNRSVKALIVNKRTQPNTTVYTYTHTKYDLGHFNNDLAANVLVNEQKDHILNCFVKICPSKKESLLGQSRNRSIVAGNTLFIDDANLMSTAIIELLYNLRCKLFHGELQPSQNNLSVYEPCYYILRILLKSLK